jgi:hypothetical protein
MRSSVGQPYLLKGRYPLDDQRDNAAIHGDGMHLSGDPQWGERVNVGEVLHQQGPIMQSLDVG